MAIPTTEEKTRAALARGFCPLCVIYDLKPVPRQKPWRRCRCCGQQWRELPGGEWIAEQGVVLREPCKHRTAA